MRKFRIYMPVLIGLFAVLVVGGIFHWTVNRIYVPEGHSLQLRYKGPLLLGLIGLGADHAPAGQYAVDGQIGVQEEMKGPGRHFYCPLWWERTLVKDIIVEPGQVALVTCKVGEDLPEGQYLVEGELYGEKQARQRGPLRKVFGPGRYRYNPYGFEFQIMEVQTKQVGNQTKYGGWVHIPTGFVGVVTYLTANDALGKNSGIQEEVLPPGLYPVNPLEQQIDIVEIGYRETSISVEEQKRNGAVVLDEGGEPVPVPSTGINFPSNDGFDIHLDFTAVWGIMPENAPKVVDTFGNIEHVELKVVLPQAESICRNNGSKMTAVQLLIGESREVFQEAVSNEFQSVLHDKFLELKYGLVRHIYIPREVRIPIQNGYIADEMKLTRQQESITAQTEAQLREAEKRVELEVERTRVETEKLRAEVLAEGARRSHEIAAETARRVAEIERQVAELAAKRVVTLGQAEAEAQQLQEEARAGKFQLAVEAFGSPDAFNRWQFAELLPQDMELRLLYAGEGTLWTDLNSIVPTLPIQPSGTRPARAPAPSGPSRTSGASPPSAPTTATPSAPNSRTSRPPANR